MYNPATGTQQLWNWDAASRTFGLFVEDTWKARKNLTLTLGLALRRQRQSVVEERFHGVRQLLLGYRADTKQEQIANGLCQSRRTMLCCTPSTTCGVLASALPGIPPDNGDWAVRGGLGIYNNWLTSANVQEEFRGSPPGLVLPTFFAGTARLRPIFVLGNQQQATVWIYVPDVRQGGLRSRRGPRCRRQLRHRRHQSAA